MIYSTIATSIRLAWQKACSVRVWASRSSRGIPFLRPWIDTWQSISAVRIGSLMKPNFGQHNFLLQARKKADFASFLGKQSPIYQGWTCLGHQTLQDFDGSPRKVAASSFLQEYTLQKEHPKVVLKLCTIFNRNFNKCLSILIFRIIQRLFCHIVKED